VSPGSAREEFEGHHVERDSNIHTSIESVRDGSGGSGPARVAPDCPALPREWRIPYTADWPATTGSTPAPP